ncbi:hypothetical protein EIMP300_27100 [Escherichia coli]|uniref:Uncharacterized protein n=1 Tax=Escherichia coli TaxID=562 RepID=A0A8S0FMW9_ECOLX|nr:hypothetical protein EIMP300_27100 [Escherichia coli]
MKDHSGAVSIGNLERYITDTALAMGWRPDVSKVVPRSEKVAGGDWRWTCRIRVC